jgi:hypothetical protein
MGGAQGSERGGHGPADRIALEGAGSGDQQQASGVEAHGVTSGAERYRPDAAAGPP